MQPARGPTSPSASSLLPRYKMWGFNTGGFGRICYCEITHDRKHQESGEVMNWKRFLNSAASLHGTEGESATVTEFRGKRLQDREMVLTHSAKGEKKS